MILTRISNARQLSTSAIVNRTVKFSVNDKMIDEYDSKKAEEKITTTEEPKADHTLKNPLIMGRVSSERYNQVIKVAIPKHRLNPRFLLYVRENDNILALDEFNICKPGDWILLRKQAEPIDLDVEHKAERLIYAYGNFVDPLTNRRSFGIYFDDDMNRLEKIKLDLGFVN